MKTILITDDSPFLRLVLKNILSKKYNVIEACDGQGTLQMFREKNPDVVLLDIVMPGLGGKEILREIREINPGAKVIMVTAVGQKAVMAECRQLGAVGYITKPFDEKEILQAISSTWGGKEQEEGVRS